MRIVPMVSRAAQWRHASRVLRHAKKIVRKSVFEFLPYFIQNIKPKINTQNVRAKTNVIQILLRQTVNFGGLAHQEAR